MENKIKYMNMEKPDLDKFDTPEFAEFLKREYPELHRNSFVNDIDVTKGNKEFSFDKFTIICDDSLLWGLFKEYENCINTKKS